MRHTTTIKHALAVALGASALAASPALGRPVDRVDPAAGTVFGSVAYDDWRGEQARDGAPAAPSQDFRDFDARHAPTVTEHPRGPGHPSQVTPKPAPIVSATKPDDGDDDVWLILGVALAATGVAAGSGAVVARRYRLRARRVPA